jgi:hypothetical protein
LTIETRVANLEAQVRTLQSAFRRLDALRATVAYGMAADKTLAREDLLMRHEIDCTVASNLTLPALELGEKVFVRNVGSATITLKDSGGSTIDTVAAGEGKTAEQASSGFEVATE